MVAKAKDLKTLGGPGTIGLELVLSVMLGLFGGRWLDGKLGTGPWLAIIGFGFGVAAGVRAIHRGWKDMQRINREEEQAEGNPAPMFPRPEAEEEADPAKKDDKTDGPP